jgi:hypothetical protein
MKTQYMRTVRLGMAAAFLLLVPACSTPVKSTGKAAVKGAKMSAKATVEGAKATGRAVKGAAGIAVGK